MREAHLAYVTLLDEAVECWCPMGAEHVVEDQYLLCGSVPEGDPVEFRPGDMVRCCERAFQDGTSGLVAFARVEGHRQG
jgi:hypothetical protein